MLNAGQQKNWPQQIQTFASGDEHREGCLGRYIFRSQRNSKVPWKHQRLDE